MLSFLPGPLLALINACALISNTLFWGALIIVFALLKLLAPFPLWHRFISLCCNRCMYYWTCGNAFTFKLTLSTQWHIDDLTKSEVDRKGWYLVLANHLSWADIVSISMVLRNDLPMLKFFLKKQLFYIPILGQACWALDMPFMHRYTKSQITKNPKLKGKDIETTRKACAKFRWLPTAVINFVEGSRLTTEKHKQQQSQFRYLMKPKAGGIAFALNTLGEQFSHIIDVTLVYPDAPKAIMAALLRGELNHIHVGIRSIPMGEVPKGDYDNDKAFRVQFQRWLNQIWQEKDEQIHQIINRYPKTSSFYQALRLTHQADSR